jgi:hypothetical protein
MKILYTFCIMLFAITLVPTTSEANKKKAATKQAVEKDKAVSLFKIPGDDSIINMPPYVIKPQQYQLSTIPQSSPDILKKYNQINTNNGDGI